MLTVVMQVGFRYAYQGRYDGKFFRENTSDQEGDDAQARDGAV